MRVSVRTIVGAAVGVRDEAWVVEERGEYRIDAPDAERAEFAGVSLARDASGFVLTLSFWTGRAQVRLFRGGVCELVELRVDAASHKLDAGEWEALLDALEQVWPGCTVGVEGGLHGVVGDRGMAQTLALLALLPRLLALLTEVAALLDSLRTRDEWVARPIPLPAVRRLDAVTARWIAAHPRVGGLVARADEASDDEPPRVPSRRRETTLDHPANRALRWMLERLGRSLQRLAARLRDEGQRHQDSLTDATAWCAARSSEVSRAAAHVDALIGRSVLSSIAPSPPDAAAMATVMNDPRYGRIYRRLRRWIAPRFERDDGADAPIRATFDLYERWCLLHLCGALKEAFPTFAWRDLRVASADGSERLHGEIALVGHGDGGQITLYDNLTFPAWREGATRYSISTMRRPDFVVAHRDANGVCRWLILDAKYRATVSSISHAMESMHVYRDALRWPEAGGACAAAVLLAPRVPEGAAGWSDATFVARFGIGVLSARPTDGRDRLVSWIRSALCTAGAR